MGEMILNEFLEIRKPINKALTADPTQTRDMLILIIQYHVFEIVENIWNYFLCVIEYKTFAIR